ncbi:MAG: substrate-binding domain-containing protein [Clostridiales bacterium]|nr:substrate-binding domain-containing protein [Clostridiales bacterium]
MKKVISILLVLVLALGVFTACSNEEDPAETTGDTEATTNDATSGDSGEALSGIVSTGGSTSVEKVMTALIYQFQEDNPDVTINYEMNGSGDGIANTISGMYEIGHSSRDLKTDGTEDGLVATAYAIDGIAVVVHQDNEVESLNADQLRDIYTGTITNWSQVGGADAPITVVTREASSGTRSAFAEIIGLEETMQSDTCPSPMWILQK